MWGMFQIAMRNFPSKVPKAFKKNIIYCLHEAGKFKHKLYPATDQAF